MTFTADRAVSPGRHRTHPARDGHPARWVTAVTSGVVLAAGAQLAAPAGAAAHPVDNPGTGTIPVPAELAAFAALPEVEALLGPLAATPPPHAVASAPDVAVASAPDVAVASAPDVAVAPAPDVAAVPAAPAATPVSAASGPFAVMPVSGTLTSAFGPRWGSIHEGLDIANSIGTPVYAAAAGTVIDSGPASGFGLWVRIRHDDGSTTTYGHINETFVQAGQRVQAGDQIATVGNRGQSTGPHLHFETTNAAGTKVDPRQWLQDRGVPQTGLVKS